MTRINESTFAELQPGMTHAEVAKLLGSRGTLVSGHVAQIEPGMPFDTMKTEVYRWRNRQGASIQVMFGHGKLRDKSQQGLS